MEHQTRFDLTTAIENWRAELDAQPDLSADNRLELETHLRDLQGELQSRGLSTEESFWLARRRVGHPQRLVEEFIKVNPAMVWRERILLIALVFLVMRLWDSVSFTIFSAIMMNNMNFQHPLENHLPKWVAFYLPQWLLNIRYMDTLQCLGNIIHLTVIGTGVVLLLRGKFEGSRSIWDFVFKNRLRVFGFGMLLLLADYSLCRFLWACLSNNQGYWISNIFVMYFYGSGFSLFWIIVLITWLVPSQNREYLKRA